MAARLGKGCSLLLILYGVLTMLRGNVFGGLWMCLIGTFLGHAATMSSQQLLARQALAGEPVRRFLAPNPVTVPPPLTIEEFVERYIATDHLQLFPVVDHGRLMGCVSIREVQQLPRQGWKQHTVGALLQPCSLTHTIGPYEDALQALATMHQTQTSRLMVADAGRFVGVITRKDLLDFLALKAELEGRKR
jgi:predicted transcriptional regulator